MGRVAAWWIIAMMANKHAYRVNPSRKKIGDSVSGKWPTVDVENPIPAIASPSPCPALIIVAPVYFRPEKVNLLCRQLRHSFTIVLSHMISSVDLWSEPRNVLIHLRGSSYFNPVAGGCKC